MTLLLSHPRPCAPSTSTLRSPQAPQQPLPAPPTRHMAAASTHEAHEAARKAVRAEVRGRVVASVCARTLQLPRALAPCRPPALRFRRYRCTLEHREDSWRWRVTEASEPEVEERETRVGCLPDNSNQKRQYRTCMPRRTRSALHCFVYNQAPIATPSFSSPSPLSPHLIRCMASSLAGGLCAIRACSATSLQRAASPRMARRMSWRTFLMPPCWSS